VFEITEGQNRRRAIEELRDGRDEMNLAEFPLASISNRFLDGTKTVVFSDTVWDEQRRDFVPRSLTISGSDLYGLPTAKDDDVLLACVQLSALGSFFTRKVCFSRYELLKLLRWKDETKNYRRLATSLRRWMGVTIYSDRAFYDHGRKSWVNRDFGVFDNLYVFEREEKQGRAAPASSWFVWNEVIFESFRSGYLKKLDWDLYCRLKDPVAKRLYRFLDKRFYRSDRVVLDLHELAFSRVRVSQNYDTAQVKRALLAGIRELESLWDLKALPPEERFRKVGPGKWEAVFSRKPKRRKRPAEPASALEEELVSRSVVRKVARGLVRDHEPEKIERMLELHDWHRRKGEPKGPGFLVASIKSEGGYALPADLEAPRQRRAREAAENCRKEAEREFAARREAERLAHEKARGEAFVAFWEGLAAGDREAFEEEAVREADATKRGGYLRSKKAGGVLFENYRRIILRDHFERRAAEKGAAQQKSGGWRASGSAAPA